MPHEIVMNAATFRKAWGFEQFIRACGARGLEKASVWGDDIRELGIKRSKQVLNEAGVQALGYNRAGPLISNNSDERSQFLQLAKREIEIATELEADHVLLFTGGLPEGSKDLREMRKQTIDIFQVLLEHSKQLGIKLAIEPMHPMICGERGCIHSLKHANDICDGLGDGVSIVVDAYHVWWDEQLDEQIARAGVANSIVGFHVSDWLVPTKHTLTDRGMMGDGVIDLSKLWQLICATGYDGPIEVELFSEYWWSKDPDQVFDLALERCSEIFGE